MVTVYNIDVHLRKCDNCHFLSQLYNKPSSSIISHKMALPHNDHDLSDPGILLSYLEHTPFASTRVDKLSGDITNFVFRLYLSKPYVEQGEQNIPLPTLILKHSKSWLSTDKEFYIDTMRQASSDNLIT